MADRQAMPAWLAESIAPTIAEMKQQQQQARAAGTAAPETARKRLRAPAAVDPSSRRLHELMAAQLTDEGHADAAGAVMRSTGCLAVPVGGSRGRGQRLARLVELGELAERSSLRRREQLRTRDTVEHALFGGSVYTAPAPMEAYEFGEVFTTLAQDRPLRCVAFSPDGAYIAVGTTHGGVRVFSDALITQRARTVGGHATSAPTHTCLVRRLGDLHSQGVEWVGFHPTEPILISCGRDGRLVATDYTEPQGRRATHLMATPQLAGVAADATGYTDTYPIRAASINPDGQHIALATDHSSLRLLNMVTGAVMMPQEAHTAGIADCCFSPDGRLLATASYDATWKIIDGRTGSTVFTSYSAVNAAHCGVAITSCQMSRSGGVLLTTGADSQTKLWDLRKSCTEIVAFGKVEKSSCILRSRFTFDEAAVVVDGPGRRTTKVIDLYSSTVVAMLEHAQQQRGLAASPVSQTIATAGDDFRMRLWAPACVTEFLPEDVVMRGGYGLAGL